MTTDNADTKVEAKPTTRGGAASPRRKQLLARALLLGVVAVVMTTIFYRIENLTYENYVRDLKLDATVQVIEARERIEEDIFDLTLSMNELATVISQNPDITATEFNVKAVDHVLAHPEIRSISAAPNDTISMVFPKFGNENLIGADYHNLMHEESSQEPVIETGEARFSGPITLSDGAQVLVLSKPVFVQTAENRQQLWGGLVVALNQDRFLSRLSIPALEERFDLLIQEVNEIDPTQQTVIYGDPSVLNETPIDLAFNFPFGQWRFMASPVGGWPEHRPNYAAIWLQRSLAMLMCLTALWYVMSLLDRRRTAEKILSDGIEALDHGFVMFDSDRRLVAFNNKYKQLAGGSGQVRIGARYEDIVKANLKMGLIPDAVGREQEWYAEWAKRIDVKEVDKEQILADGRLIRAYDRPLEDGSVVGLRIDITDLKRAQIAAEAANKAKTDFMGVLSHELRTPLTVILGHAQLAKNIHNMPVYKKLVAELEAHPEALDDVSPKLDAVSGQIVKMMEALERSGNHLFTLISEILDFAKIDSGTLSMEMEDVTSDAVVEPVVDQMRPMVEDKGLKLELESETCDINADAKRIQQVLINLISNASKFTDEGKISVKVRQTDENVIFSVADSGIGIPEDQLIKVFEAFHQVDNSSGRKYGGTGLGLAISRDIAKAHGGDLFATSVQGEGSVFTLTLPRPAAKAQPEEAEEEIEPLVA